MASDLSKIIPENLSTTLSALLAKDTALKECTKVDKRDFENSELLKIDVEFVFDKLTSLFSYYIPATSASRIFNVMMGATDHEISSKIDDDTADAMAEFISNTCGGLVTTINASEFEDLGKSKFNIKHKEVFDGNSLESVDNIYRFLIEIEEEQVILFTQFEENFSSFITELTNAQPTFYKEEEQREIPEAKVEEEVVEKNVVEEKEEKNKLEKETEDTTKSIKLKPLIMIISGLIGLTIFIGIVMYFLGMFESEPIKKPKDINTTLEPKDKIEMVKYKPLKKVDFKMSDINIERLNNKFELLTKYQILTQAELEAQAQEEKKRIIQLKKEQALIEFAKQNKEEPLILKPKEEPTINNDVEPIQEEATPKVDDTPTLIETKVEEDTKAVPNDKLKFILANSLKYKLFKELVLQTNSTKARISICNNDNGKTQIFIGPFETEELQVKMNTLIRDSNENVETLIANITQAEFDAKCSF